jgi:hypothetical protein
MARATTARQLANLAVRNNRNSTASAAGAAIPLAGPPQPPVPGQPLVADSEVIDTSIDALNRRLLQDQIDHNATINTQTLQFAAAAEERRIEREAFDH